MKFKIYSNTYDELHNQKHNWFLASQDDLEVMRVTYLLTYKLTKR